MELHYSERFHRSYANAPRDIQRAFGRRVAFLVRDLRHPSLRAKIYDEAKRLGQARVNGGWRFYFRIEGNVYHLIDIMPHPK